MLSEAKIWFLGIAGFLLVVTAHNWGGYEGFAIFLRVYAGFSHIMFGLMIFVLYRLEMLGREVLQRPPDIDPNYEDHDGGVKELYVMMSCHVLIITISGAFVGEVLITDGWWLNIFHVPYAIFFYIANIAFFATLLGMSPIYIAGVIAVFTWHPAARPVERSARRRRPDREVERDLALVLQSQSIEDAELQALFHELSPWKKWYWQVRYRARAREARRLRELTQAKTKAYDEETDLAHSVHVLERLRRHLAGE